VSIVLSRHIYFPLGDLLKGTPVAAILRDLERSQWLSEEKLAALRAEKIARTIEDARLHVPFYRERLAGIGPVTARNALEVLAGIPILSRAQVFERGVELRSEARVGRILEGRTSGSSGMALDFSMTPEFLAHTEAAQWRGRGWWGMRRGDPMLTLWGRSVRDPRAAEKIARRERRRNWLRISAFELSRKEIAGHVEAIEEFRPQFIYGYSSAIYQLALFYSEEERRPPPGLKAIFFTADALLSFQRRLVEETLRAPTVCEYGSSEAGAFAFECREGGVHLAGENIYVEVVRGGAPVGDGEEGEVVVTVLRNRAMPLIRYNLGDWARKVPGQCPCGRTLPRIELTNSKVVDIVRTSRGRAASGHLFDYILIELIDLGLRGIRQFLVVQKELDRFTVQVVPGPDLDAECLGLFERRMRERLGDQISVGFEVVPEIPREPFGKIRYYRSEIGGDGPSSEPAVEARAALARRR
jgi:phenylacetate-CoA ligase